MRTATLDPVRDGRSRTVHYIVSEEDAVVDVSRRGARLHCASPPAPGTRLLLQFELPGDERRFELVGSTRWTRVEFVPGKVGARAIAAVGIEFVSGTGELLRLYEQRLNALARRASSLASPNPVG